MNELNQGPTYKLGRFLARTTLVVCAAQTALTPAFALPDPIKGNPLSKLGITAPSQIPMLGDSENAKLIYVGPREYQEAIGTYHPLDGVFDCNSLRDARNRFYASPEDNIAFERAVTNGDPISPFFDATTGFALYHRKKLVRVANAKAEVTDFLDKHKTQYGEFAAALQSLEALQNEMKDLEASEGKAQSTLTTTITLVGNDPTLSTETRTKMIQQAREDFKKAIAQIAKQKAEKQVKIEAARARYTAAVKAWAPYRDQLDHLQKVETSLSGSLNALYELAKTQYRDGLAILTAAEQRPVGMAVAGYNVFSDEASTVANLLSDAGSSYTVSKLNIFDVTLNSGIIKSVLPAQAITEANAKEGLSPYRAVTVNIPSNTLTVVGESAPFRSAFSGETDPSKPLNILMGDYLSNYGSSGSYEMIVTQGAFCGAAEESQSEYKYKDPETGSVVPVKISAVKYKSPAPGQAVFAQNVSLKYKYVAKAEPLEGNCTLNVRQMDNYWRSSGHESSWSLFGGSRSHSWDDTRETIAKHMGLSCKLKNRPQGSNPAEWSQRERDMTQALYADMMAMFVMEYAKSYKIEKGEPIVTEGPHPMATAGSAVLNLCGATNVYCAIGGIVMKTVDELTGGHASGSTSSVQEITGTITRDFSVDGYFIADGSANITLKVCVDKTKCSTNAK